MLWLACKHVYVQFSWWLINSEGPRWLQTEQSLGKWSRSVYNKLTKYEPVSKQARE